MLASTLLRAPLLLGLVFFLLPMPSAKQKTQAAWSSASPDRSSTFRAQTPLPTFFPPCKPSQADRKPRTIARWSYSSALPETPTVCLLHRISVGINLVNFAQIELANSAFDLAHVAHNDPDQVVRQDQFFGQSIGFFRSYRHGLSCERRKIIFRQVVP